MKKNLGKRNLYEQGTFFAYACDCGCGGLTCNACTCNSVNPSALAESATRIGTNDKLKYKSYGGMFLI